MTWSAVALIAYFVWWASVHSLLASLRFKRWTVRALGERAARWYRLGFNIFSGITILPVLAMLALLPDRTLYIIPFPLRWFTLGGQILALAALLWTWMQTSPMHFLGLAQLLAADPTLGDPLEIRGFYCYVRHPLYLFSIILLWLMPSMSANQATVSVLITLYFILGSVLEERKLLIEFGEPYAEYRQRVPRLIPRLKRCAAPPSKTKKS